MTLFFVLLFVGLFAALLWPVKPNPHARIVRAEYHNLITEQRHTFIGDFHEELRRRVVVAGVPDAQFEEAYRDFLDEQVRDER